MKTAIILASEEYFNKVEVLKDDPIKWLDSLYDQYGTIHVDGITVYLDLADFAYQVNNGSGISADEFMVVVKYDSYDGQKFYNNGEIVVYDDWGIPVEVRSADGETVIKDLRHTEADEKDKVVEQANADLAEVIGLIHNCKSLDEVCEVVSNTAALSFGACNKPTDGQIDIDYGTILTSVWMQDNVLVINPNVQIVGDEYDFVQYLSEEGVTGVASQDADDIYLKPDEPEKSESKEEKPKTIYEQFNDACLKHNDYLVLMTVGDFYETYDAHAEKISEILGLTLCHRNSNGKYHYIAGFPKRALDSYLAKLIRSGYKVAIETGNGESQLFPNVKMKTEPQEKESTNQKTKLDSEFVDHVADILREGHRVICVEVSGEKYVINGLFDNEDLIVDVYIADSMKRIDRYFVIGAQDGVDNEAEYYAEYFMEHIVKDANLNDSWYLSDKQFQFLKNA